MNLSGHTILITGGTRGIGLELARQFLARENTVLVTGRDHARLDALGRQLPGLHTFQSDVSRPDDIARLFDDVTSRFPALDVLVNNAGIMRVVNLHASADGLEDVSREIQTNLVGPMQMVNRFLPHLKGRPRAAIVNITSGLAFVPLAISPIYCASKAGLHSYTQSLRVQLEGTPVEVFELAPPATQTDIGQQWPEGLVDQRTFMDVTKLVKAALEGLAKGKREILPGLSAALRLLGRVAPRLALIDAAGKKYLALASGAR